jgi:dTDP-glucose 4,6-dehydratase
VSEELPDVNGLDAVLHFASPASPKDYDALRLETLAVNSRGTEACCRLALQNNARLVFASTSEVYGDPLEHPQRESYWGNVNSIGERACYDEAKRYGEAAVMAYRHARGLDGRVVRIFNTYGPRMRPRDGRVVPTFIDQALRGDALTIYGTGEQTRSLCYVDDLVEGILRFAQIDRPPHAVVNLGNDEEVTVRAIAEIVARLCAVPLNVVHAPLPPDDPTRRRPDLARAGEMLNWRPQISMEDGLARTIAWFKSTQRTEERKITTPC